MRIKHSLHPGGRLSSSCVSDTCVLPNNFSELCWGWWGCLGLASKHGRIMRIYEDLALGLERIRGQNIFLGM